MRWKTKRRVIDLSKRSVVMGILNATPDSFSDGGLHAESTSALQRALEMVQEGAEIIDVGGESTRPGADSVSAELEMARVIPVIEQLRSESDVFISIDTTKASVARAALVAGADIVNDVSGLTADSEMVDVCVEFQAAVVVMHRQCMPKTMQDKPQYNDVLAEVLDYFHARYDILTKAGISAEALCFDPGIGFGKTLEQNFKLLAGVGEMSVHERPVLLGVSRKSFIGAALKIENPAARDAASVAVSVQARLAGCMLHRVHAVRETVEALRIAEEVLRYG